jgi:hypothetical protein
MHVNKSQQQLSRTNLEDKESAVVEINAMVLKFDSDILELNSFSIQSVEGRVVLHGSSRHL